MITVVLRAAVAADGGRLGDGGANDGRTAPTLRRCSCGAHASDAEHARAVDASDPDPDLAEFATPESEPLRCRFALARRLPLPAYRLEPSHAAFQ